MSQQSVIHVLYVVHDYFGGTAQHLAAAMASVLENTKSKVHIHLFHNPDLPSADIGKLSKMIKRYEQEFDSYAVQIDDSILNKIPRIAEYTPGVLYHLKVADLVKENIKRIIYLDFDTIVHDDIQRLFEEDLKGNCVGLVPLPEKSSKKMLAEDFPDGKSPILPSEYYNTGVMLMDLQSVRQKHDLWNESISFLLKYPELQYLDQTALCCIFNGEILPLNERYNLGATRKQGVHTPGIYHYKGPWRTKPWNCVDKNISVLYWKYLIKAQWLEPEECLLEFANKICLDEVIVKNPMRNKKKVIRMFLLRLGIDFRNVFHKSI